MRDFDHKPVCCLIRNMFNNRDALILVAAVQEIAANKMNLGRAGVLLERFGVQKVFSRAESSGVKQKILSRDGYRLTKDNFTDTYTLDVNKTGMLTRCYES